MKQQLAYLYLTCSYSYPSRAFYLLKEVNYGIAVPPVEGLLSLFAEYHTIVGGKQSQWLRPRTIRKFLKCSAGLSVIQSYALARKQYYYSIPLSTHQL